jgi:hypothetical protein
MLITHTRVTSGIDNGYGKKPYTVEHVMEAEIPLKDLKKFVTKFTKMIKSENKRSDLRGVCAGVKDKENPQFAMRFEV